MNMSATILAYVVQIEPLRHHRMTKDPQRSLIVRLDTMRGEQRLKLVLWKRLAEKLSNLNEGDLIACTARPSDLQNLVFHVTNVLFVQRACGACVLLRESEQAPSQGAE